MTQTAPPPRPTPSPGRPPGPGGPGPRAALLAALAVLVILAVIAVAGVMAVTRLAAPEPELGPGETVFPLPAEYANSYTNDWGAARPQGRHEGTDVYAPEGTPIYAITSGAVTLARGSDEDGWNTLGGYTVTVRADRDAGLVERGDYLYYAHLQSPSPLQPGDRVDAGEQIGAIGRTAGEEPGTLGDFPPHLHLGWYEGGWGGGRAEAESGAMNPYPMLHQIELVS